MTCEAPLPGQDAQAGGLLVPLSAIRSIGYATEETGAGECHVAWLWLTGTGLSVNVSGYNLAGLVEAFRRGQVDFVQVYDEARRERFMPRAPIHLCWDSRKSAGTEIDQHSD